MIPDAIRPAAEALLEKAGFPSPVHFVRIDGGGNNQVYRAESGGRLAALKVYFHHPQDQRDRLNAEYSFSTLLWQHGVENVPRPLAIDRTARLALYEFVAGNKLLPEEVDASAIDVACDFFASINTPALRAAGKGLPPASEACFSTVAHLTTVRRRLDRLDGLSGATPVDREAGDFVRGQVLPFWHALEADVLATTARLGLAPQEEIAAGALCISPSDFGFHNALREAAGRLRFIDFEYAGWDDPAKLVGDFFNQVQAPVPRVLFGTFARRVASLFPEDGHMLARFEILLPVYSVKWITIMLNDFLPVGEMRRSFAGDTSQALARKRGQLAKARQAFARLAVDASLPAQA
ncbi:MAG: phosphotransferase [Rhizomicrobium sp.]